MKLHQINDLRATAQAGQSAWVAVRDGQLVPTTAGHGYLAHFGNGTIICPHIKSQAYKQLQPAVIKFWGKPLRIIGSPYTTNDPPNTQYHLFYHGTGSHNLPKIQQQGLRPSRHTGNTGMGGQTGYSDTEIYLSAHPGYAASGAGISADNAHAPEAIVLEIDLSNTDLDQLLPDDNYGKTWQDTYESGGGVRAPFPIEPTHISIYARATRGRNGWHFTTKDGKEFDI